MLSEREAWLAIGRDWRAPINTGGKYEYWSSRRMASGLCASIVLLSVGKQIDLDIYRVMHDKIDKQVEKSGLDSWAWGHTKKDALARAAFCRRQAAKLKVCKNPDCEAFGELSPHSKYTK